MSVYQEFLIWSCSIGDEALLDIFWKRTPNPIKSAVMVSSLCNSLGKIHAAAMDADPADQEAYLVRYPRARELIPALDGISNKYAARASRMMAYTLSADDTNAARPTAKYLGTDWAMENKVNREVRRLMFIDMAFTAEMDKQTKQANEQTKTHPALQENVREYWDEKGGRAAHVREGILKLILLGLHVYTCSITRELVARAASPGAQPPASDIFEALPLHPVELVFWVTCTARSLQLLLVSLDPHKFEATNNSESIEVVYCTLSHVGISLRLVAGSHSLGAVIGAGTCATLGENGARVLSWAVCFLSVSFMFWMFQIFQKSRIGTVLSLYQEVLVEQDNQAFILLIGMFCVTFSLTLTTISDLDKVIINPSPSPPPETETCAPDTAHPPPPPQSLDVDTLLRGVRSGVDAVGALGLEAGSLLTVALAVEDERIHAESLDLKWFFFLFFMFANTYLVQGFLVGIISESFIDKQHTAQTQLLLQKLELVRGYRAQDAAAARIPILGIRLPFLCGLDLPFNAWRVLCKVEFTGLWFLPESVQNQLLSYDIIFQTAELTNFNTKTSWINTVDAAYRFMIRTAFLCLILLLLVITGPGLPVYLLNGGSKIDDIRVDTPSSDLKDSDSTMDATKLDDARKLELDALQQWQRWYVADAGFLPATLHCIHTLSLAPGATTTGPQRPRM